MVLDVVAVYDNDGVCVEDMIEQNTLVKGGEGDFCDREWLLSSLSTGERLDMVVTWVLATSRKREKKVFTQLKRQVNRIQCSINTVGRFQEFGSQLRQVIAANPQPIWHMSDSLMKHSRFSH